MWKHCLSLKSIRVVLMAVVATRLDVRRAILVDAIARPRVMILEGLKLDWLAAHRALGLRLLQTSHALAAAVPSSSPKKGPIILKLVGMAASPPPDLVKLSPLPHRHSHFGLERGCPHPRVPFDQGRADEGIRAPSQNENCGRSHEKEDSGSERQGV